MTDDGAGIEVGTDVRRRNAKLSIVVCGLCRTRDLVQILDLLWRRGVLKKEGDQASSEERACLGGSAGGG
jgi:hypothetical protein